MSLECEKTPAGGDGFNREGSLAFRNQMEDRKKKKKKPCNESTFLGSICIQHSPLSSKRGARKSVRFEDMSSNKTQRASRTFVPF